MDYQAMALEQAGFINALCIQNQTLLKACTTLELKMAQLSKSTEERLGTKEKEIESLKDQLRKASIHPDAAQKTIRKYEEEILQRNQIHQSELEELMQQLSYFQNELKVRDERIVELEEEKQQYQINEGFQYEQEKVQIQEHDQKHQIEKQELLQQSREDSPKKPTPRIDNQHDQAQIMKQEIKSGIEANQIKQPFSTKQRSFSIQKDNRSSSHKQKEQH